MAERRSHEYWENYARVADEAYKEGLIDEKQWTARHILAVSEDLGVSESEAARLILKWSSKSTESAVVKESPYCYRCGRVAPDLGTDEFHGYWPNCSKCRRAACHWHAGWTKPSWASIDMYVCIECYKQGWPEHL